MYAQASKKRNYPAARLMPIRCGIMHWWLFFVRMSVPYLTLNREWEDVWSWKLAGKKHITRVTLDPFTGGQVKHLPGEENFGIAQLVFYRDANVQQKVSALWHPIWKIWVAVQIISLRGRGHIVAASRTACWILMLFCFSSCHSFSFSSLWRTRDRPKLMQSLDT